MSHPTPLRIGVSLTAALAALLTTAPQPAVAQQAETFRLGGDAVAIYNLAGEVRVRGGSGPEVAVTVRPGGAEASRLAIQTGRVDTYQRAFDSVMALRVVYPSETIVYRESGGDTEIRVRENGTFFGYSEAPGYREGDRVRIRSSGSGVEAHADLEVSVPEGRSVFIALAVGEGRIENVAGSLTVDVASANVHADGGRGDFVLDTGSGDVTVTEHEGDLICDTGSGNVTLTTVSGNELNFDTGSGDVTGHSIRGTTIRVDTGSGDVTLEFVTGPRDILVDVGSGDVRLKLPDSYSAHVEIDTGSGDISTDIPIEVTEISEDQLVGRIRDGSGRLQIDTGSGDVRIEQG
jgi:hypothetical protein